MNGSELSGACALFGPHRQVSERVAVALRRDAKLLLPHVARVSAAAGEQYRDLAVPRFEFKLGEKPPKGKRDLEAELYRPYTPSNLFKNSVLDRR